LVAKASKLL
jgi:hypothetical protein